MKRYFRVLFGVLLLAAMVISCERDGVEDVESYDPSDQVSVSLAISVDAMGYGTEESRSDEATRSSILAADNDGISSEVKSLWIAQVNGTATTSQVMMAHYVEDVSVDNALDLTFIQRATSTTMVYIANIAQKDSSDADLITTGMTLAAVRALAPTLSAPTSASQLYTEGLVTTLSGTNYFTMSDEVVVTAVNSSTALTASLKRNAVKVTINLLNQWHDSTITGVTLKSVASTTEYHLNHSGFDTTSTYPTIGDDYTAIDHPEYALDIAGDIFATDATSINFYIPANMRGTDSSSTEESTKPTYAPTGATYLVISAEDEGDFLYTYYLGANLTNDYNLMPNYHYTYDVTFTGVGNVDNDPRIEITSIVADYSTMASSNCYIINPSDDYDKIYYIPIEERINDYWVNYDTTSAYSSAPLSDDATIDDWSFEVLWDDSDDDPIADDRISIEQAVRNEKRCLVVTIPKGGDTSKLNVFVAVKDNNGDILWSWHFWITDYNPYNVNYEADKHIYTVDGGELHHYGALTTTTSTNETLITRAATLMAIWGEGGIYEDKLIMDRSIGADTSDESTGYYNLLFYQYGRKDPITNYSKTNFGTTTGPTTMTASVREPMKFITTEYVNWCTDYTESTYIWNDEDIPTTATEGKSIFDPSPFGFRIPVENFFLTSLSTTAATYKYTYNLRYLNASGTLSGYYSSDNCGYDTWTTTPYTEDSYKAKSVEAYYQQSPTFNDFSSSSLSRSSGCVIRPVQE